MPLSLQQTRDLLRRASNRARGHAALGRSATGAIVGATFALGLVVWGKFAPLPWPWWWSLVLTPIVGSALGGASALFSRWSVLRAARELESRLPLEDRLSSALQLAGASPGDPFACVAMEDAERLSARIDVRSVLPFLPRRWWLAGPALIVACAAVGLWVPSIVGSASVVRQQILGRERDAAAARLAEVMPLVSDAAPTSGPGATDRELAALEDIQRELSAERLSPAEAVSRAAQAIDRVADRLEERSRTELDEFDRARRALAEAARGRTAPPVNADSHRPGPGDLSAIRRALASGDVEGAAKAAENAAGEAEGMRPEQRRALAEDLAELGRELDRTQSERPDSENPAHQRAPGAPKPPHDDATEPPGGDSASSDRLARAIKDAAEELKNEKLSERSAAPKRPSQSRRAEGSRDKSEERSPEGPDGSKHPGDYAKPVESSSAARNDPGTSVSKSAADPKPDADDSKNQNVGETPRNSERNEERGATNGRENDAPQGNRRPHEGTGAKDADGTNPKSDKGTPAGSDRRESADRTAAPKSERSQSGKSNSDPTARDQPTSDQPRTDETSDPTPATDPRGKTAMERLAQELREAGAKPDYARDNAQNAREMREHARKMLEGVSPGQREKLERLAEESQKEVRRDPSAQPQSSDRVGDRGAVPGRQPGGDAPADSPSDEPTGTAPPQSSSRSGDRGAGPQGRDDRRSISNEGERRTRILDARPKPTERRAGIGAETVVSAWSGPPDASGKSTARERAAVADRFKSAASGAERSVEQQAVPQRYGDLVRRVFRKYVERASADSAAPQPPVPSLTPDATDVPRSR